MSPPNSQEPAISTSVLDKETRATAETLEALQGHQVTGSLPEDSSLSTPPGEAIHFEGGGLMDTVWQAQKRSQKIRHPSHSAVYTQHTCQFDHNNTIEGHHSSQGVGRGFD